MVNKELLMAAVEVGPLTENNLIVQSSRGEGWCSVKDALGKGFTIDIGLEWVGGEWVVKDQVFSVVFPVTIEDNPKWENITKVISNAVVKYTDTFGDGAVVTPIDPSKPAIIDVYDNY